MSNIINAMQLSSQGLSVQRKKMNAVAKNIANADTTRTPEGGPYKPERVVVSEDKARTAFSAEMQRLGTRLSRTNENHLPAKLPSVRQGVELSTVAGEEQVDQSGKVRMVYDPSHPDADDNGFVAYPDIEIVNEMVDMMAATRAYEANTIAIAAAKSIAEKALDI